MRHTPPHGDHRRFAHPDHPDHADPSATISPAASPTTTPEPRPRHPHGRHHGHHHSGGLRRSHRPFDYGELRLLILSMIATQPSHGYELIKAIESRMGGAYTPSPGVIYPTLTLLEEQGHASVISAEAGRKQYAITAEGRAALSASQPALEAILARLGQPDGSRPAGAPAPIIRAMENLKVALRLRLAAGSLTQDQAEAIASALDQAAKTVEHS